MSRFAAKDGKIERTSIFHGRSISASKGTVASWQAVVHKLVRDQWRGSSMSSPSCRALVRRQHLGLHFMCYAHRETKQRRSRKRFSKLKSAFACALFVSTSRNPILVRSVRILGGTRRFALSKNRSMSSHWNGLDNLGVGTMF